MLKRPESNDVDAMAFCPLLKGDCVSDACAFFGGVDITCMLQKLLCNLDYLENTEKDIAQINEKLSRISESLDSIRKKPLLIH